MRFSNLAVALSPGLQGRQSLYPTQWLLQMHRQLTQCQRLAASGAVLVQSCSSRLQTTIPQLSHLPPSDSWAITPASCVEIPELEHRSIRAHELHSTASRENRTAVTDPHTACHFGLQERLHRRTDSAVLQYLVQRFKHRLRSTSKSLVTPGN